MILTKEQMEAAKSPRGGWTRKQLAAWGVPWPPPKGWRKELLGRKPRAAEQVPRVRDLKSMLAQDETAAQLLRKVVVAIINKGHASDLYEFEDVLDYFGSRVPSEEETAELWKGRDDKMNEEYRAIVGRA